MSFRSRFRRQQHQSDAAVAAQNNKKRESISRFLSISPRLAASLTSSLQSPLAPFDACIEACDALAASSSVKSPAAVIAVAGEDGEGKISNHDLSEVNQDELEQNNNDASHNHQWSSRGSSSNSQVLSDCSVLVSPDGALLFTSSQRKDYCCANPTDDKEGASNDDSANTHDRPWTQISSIENRDGVILDEEYESAVICGNDLHPSGDYGCNGFSARGWDCDAATSAVRTSCEVVKLMEQFVEELALCRKDEAARVLSACSTLGMYREKLIQNNNNHANSTLQRRGGYGNSNLTLNDSNSKNPRNRFGPLISSGTDLGTNISVALETMEEYFSMSAESDSTHWRDVCIESTRDEVFGQDNDDNNAKFRGMLPKLRHAATKAKIRTSNREKALNDVRLKVSEAQNILLKQKEWAANQWKRVKNEDDRIDRLLVERREEQQQHLMSEQRQRELTLLDRTESEPDISEDVWEMVRGVALQDDFRHTGYSPRVRPKVSVFDSHHVNESINNGVVMATPHQLQINRCDIEKESEIQEIRIVALAAEESVEDASSQLLNILSKQDTTMRSARVAAESCLLSECNAVHKCLRSLVAVERAALEERKRRLQIFETAVDAIDVRKDINMYIKNDKLLPGGCSRTGDDDDGGIAAALAVLNSHVEGGTDSPPHPHIERPNHFEGWGDDNSDGCNDADDVDPELFGEVIMLLFDRDSSEKAPQKTEPDSPRRGKREHSVSESFRLKKEEMVALASTVLEERTKRGQSFRQSVLYELNNQRSKNTEVVGENNFESLCCIFHSFLSGCCREAIDVSNAKMLMILSQTFFFLIRNKKVMAKLITEKAECMSRTRFLIIQSGQMTSFGTSRWNNVSQSHCKRVVF